MQRACAALHSQLAVGVEACGRWTAEVVLATPDGRGGTRREVVGTSAHTISTVFTGDGSMEERIRRNEVPLEEKYLAMGVLTHYYFGGRSAKARTPLRNTDVYALEVSVWHTDSGDARRVFDGLVTNAVATPGAYSSDFRESQFVQLCGDGVKMHVGFDVETTSRGAVTHWLKSVSFFVTHARLEWLLRREKARQGGRPRAYVPAGCRVNRGVVYSDREESMLLARGLAEGT